MCQLGNSTMNAALSGLKYYAQRERVNGSPPSFK
jgi:hypothetical protein